MGRDYREKVIYTSGFNTGLGTGFMALSVISFMYSFGDFFSVFFLLIGLMCLIGGFIWRRRANKIAPSATTSTPLVSETKPQ